MGLREAWAGLLGRRVTEHQVAKAAEVLDVFGAPDAKEQARGMLAGVLPYSTPPKRGTLGLMLLYATAPWLRSVVGRTAQRISATEWEVEKVVGTDGKAIRSKRLQDARSREARRGILKSLAKAGAELQPLEDHPALEFLRTGNTVLDGRTAMQVTAIHALLKGEAYWLIERWQEGPLVGLPRYFWPVPPFWVAETPTVNRPYYRMQFAGWNPTHVPENEVVRFTDPDPFNPIGRGIGLGEALTDELDADEFAKKWVKGRLYNQGIPRTVVSMEGGSETEAKRIQEEWRQSFSGVMNHFKTWFTPRKLLISQLEPKFEEMKLLELRESVRDGTLEMFGYPKELLGILDNANRSTIDTAEFRHEKYGVEPWREFFRHGMQHRLMPQFPGAEKGVLGYVNEVPADREFMLQTAKVRPYALTNNELRELGGFDVTDEAWGEERPPTPTTAPGDTEVIPGGGGGFGGGKSAGDPAHAGDPEWTRDLRARRKAQEEQDDQGADWSPDGIEEIVSAVDEDAVAKELGNLTAQALEDFAKRALASLADGDDGAGAFDATSPEVKKYLEDAAGGRIDDINDTTRGYLRDYLAQAYEDGLSIDEIADALSSDTNFAFGDSRAERIARTEVVGASNFGTLEGFRQSGAVEEKGWMATPGTSGSRNGGHGQADHESLDGHEIALGAKWTEPVFGDELDHPGDGPPRQCCNCRCSLYAVVKDPGEKSAWLARAKATAAEFHAHQDRWAVKLEAAAARGLAKQRKAVVAALRKSAK